jgi:urease accessory protein
VILVHAVVGNSADARWQDLLTGATVDELLLDQWEAQKNRLRKASQGGTEVAIALDRGSHLRDGDVLVWNPERRTAVVARISLREVLVIHLEGLRALPPEEAVRSAVELGHALGNQHWPAVVKGSRVFVPLTVDRQVMASVMKTHALQGITYDFAQGSDVIPYLAPHESRRLFGGAEDPAHTHSHPHHD